MSTRRQFLATATSVSLFYSCVSTGPAAAPLQSIAAADAPKAIGPYSQAIRAGNAIYLSGQIALDPASGSLIAGDFAAQARRVLDNLKAVLREAGTDFGHVVKSTVYLADVANFQTLNGIYAEYFGNHKPARSTVGVAALPRGAAIEIDLIAIT